MRRKRGKREPVREKGPRVNYQIRASTVRLIDENGKQIGIVPLQQALETAFERGLDLVEVAPNADPPVVRIMDYGKWKFEQKKKAKESKKHQTKEKEIKLRPSISEHDLEVKIKKAREFLEDGDKVRIVVFFRGRENLHRELGTQILQRFIEKVADLSQVDKPPTSEGRTIFAILAPLKK